MAGVMATAVLVSVLIIVATTIAVLTATESGSKTDTVQYDKETDPAHWHNVAFDELQEAIHQIRHRGVAKNVILFIGDGMGVTSVTAGRILAGQMKNMNGEEHRLSFDNFPYTGLSVTYNVDTQTTDSAASATAYVTGVKTRQGMLGVSAKAWRGNCSSADGAQVNSILKWFANAGKSTGVVTTTSVTHATPASTYAHVPERNWESDRLIPESERQCTDIALQLVCNNSDINVVMGGGRVYFNPANYTDPDPRDNFPQEKYTRLDGRTLTQEWTEDKAKKGAKHAYVTSKSEFDGVDPDNTDYLLGLFNQQHMYFEVDRDATKEPSLAEMTNKAIRILQKNTNGYFLLIEGGRIDMGHHRSQPSKALHDVVAFSNAVEEAVKLTNDEDTLIVVTADHSHVMSIAGYADRGHPILGKSNHHVGLELDSVTDHKPYTTILYANGPGYHSPRENITAVNTENKTYISQSAIPMKAETHGGEDVAIYARGPHAFLYSGVHEQNYIPILMAYASCVGPYADSRRPCANTSYLHTATP